MSPSPSLLTAESSVVGQPLLFTHHIIRCLPFLPAINCSSVMQSDFTFIYSHGSDRLLIWKYGL